MTKYIPKAILYNYCVNDESNDRVKIHNTHTKLSVTK